MRQFFHREWLESEMSYLRKAMEADILTTFKHLDKHINHQDTGLMQVIGISIHGYNGEHRCGGLKGLFLCCIAL